MKWHFKLYFKDDISCHIVCETGWFSNKWRRAHFPSAVEIGSSSHGTWKYDPAQLCGMPSGLAGIKLFQQNNELVGILYIDKYPPKVDDRGEAEIHISTPAVSKVDSFWWLQSQS